MLVPTAQKRNGLSGDWNLGPALTCCVALYVREGEYWINQAVLLCLSSPVHACLAICQALVLRDSCDRAFLNWKRLSRLFQLPTEVSALCLRWAVGMAFKGV